ncbi:MAG: pyrimidine dimer DNA glycosylase/endonuclease V [Thermoguttaceae bacterium]
MRLWSLHPENLDTQGLLAVWREGLLAQKVLEGKTSGYRNHPQLDRFKEQSDPILAISRYLLEVFREAQRREYNFSEEKIAKKTKSRLQNPIPVTFGQIVFEREHLHKKLLVRAPELAEKLPLPKKISLHPSFIVVPGNVESWEKINYTVK